MDAFRSTVSISLCRGNPIGLIILSAPARKEKPFAVVTFCFEMEEIGLECVPAENLFALPRGFR